MDYATLYKKLTLSNGKPTIASICDGHSAFTATTFEAGLFNYLHTVRVVPPLGRLQLLYSYRSVPAATPGKYKVQLGVTPIGTIWNPYDVALTCFSHNHHFVTSLPPAFQFRIGSHYSPTAWTYVPGELRDASNYNIDQAQSGGARIKTPGYLDQYRRPAVSNGPSWAPTTGNENWWKPKNFNYQSDNGLYINVLSTMSLAPGENKVINMHGTAGYNPESLLAFTEYGDIELNTGTFEAPIVVNEFDAGDQISLAARFDSHATGHQFKVGAFYEMRDTRNPLNAGTGAPRVGDGNFYVEKLVQGDGGANIANNLWPPMAESQLTSSTVSAVYNSDSTKNVGVPFLSVIFGPRLSSGSGSPTKGFLQTNPLGLNNWFGRPFEMGINSFLASSPDALGGQRMLDQGARGAGNNPVNAPRGFSFITHTSWNAVDNLPNCSQDGKNNGYLISGTQSGDGLKRIAVAELPLRPLGSLAELQHWDLRKDNPAPPHQFNIIANSDAQPLFSPNAVIRDGVGIPNAPAQDPTTKALMPEVDLQHDDSYCANHLLFDDWFFSTIAPQPTTFGPTGKTLQQTFTAFVRVGGSPEPPEVLPPPPAPLDNRAYRPILEDSGITTAQATTLFNTKVNAAESYRSIASRLEVDGMFNVNSTSVKAWRALLGHARNQRVPYYDGNGNIVLSAPTDYATSRTTVASDVQAGENGSSGDFAAASEYSGYRVFTAEMLDQMAEEMVKQVRLRGPFLSLSEFVNRQLVASGDSTPLNSDDDTPAIKLRKELALAGAVQSALNVLAEDDTALNPDYDPALNPYKVLQADSDKTGDIALGPVKNAGSGFDKFPEASRGKSAYGMPGWPRQADILRPLAPILSARDDTFTIRTYCDARDANGKVIAKAWCEATVRRGRDFVYPTQDAADSTPPPAVGTANHTFGRRFQLVSFRWLNASEV